MVALILCVCCSVLVTMLFKWAKYRDLHIAQAVAVNYLVGIVANLILLKPTLSWDEAEHLPWPSLLLLGVLLPSIFIVMGKAVYHAGMVRADAAKRLSLFLPLLASATIFGEKMGGLKTVGLGLSLVAILALVWHPKAKMATKNQLTQTSGMLLGLVWFGYGTCDFLFKHISQMGTKFPVALLVAFVLAAILIWMYLLVKRETWNRFSIVFGLVLGVLNFANIYLYIIAHQQYAQTPSIVFASVNVGVLILSMLIGTVVWRERLQNVNYLGFVLGAVAIFCLYLEMKA